MYGLGYSFNIRSNMPCEVIVRNLGHHDAIDCYDANVLDEIEQEMQIIIMRLQHWTWGKRKSSYTYCMFGMQVRSLKDIYMH